jgi:hypothetical protein
MDWIGLDARCYYPVLGRDTVVFKLELDDEGDGCLESSLG